MKAKSPKSLDVEYLRRAIFPVLVSVGDRDGLISVDEARRFCQSLPKGELFVVPNAEHGIRSLREEVFVPVVLDFF